MFLQTHSPSRRQIPRRFLALLLPAILVACGGNSGSEMQMPPTPVSVATVVDREVSQWEEFTGRIEAVDRVEIRPRVGGYLTGVHFEEGALVKKGDRLFSIDDREYVAALASAKADVARARSRLTLAEEEYARSEKLIAARAVSEGELQSRRGELLQAQADIAAAEARQQQAALNVQFSHIDSPISGRVGAALVKPGNLVSPGESLLTTVVSVDPIYVTFEGDERAYLRYQAMVANGSRESARGSNNPVRVGLANETGFPHSGELDFIDNALDPSSGTIRVRALLPNPDGLVIPGLFARVQLQGAEAERALLIHEQAVMTDQDRKYVFVVGEGDTAERRDLVLGGSVDGLRIVESGLAPGDRVVVNGTKKIFFPGAPLVPQEVPMDEPNSVALVASGS
jgi:multidrug efflux system membrane fusion protein